MSKDVEGLAELTERHSSSDRSSLPKLSPGTETVKVSHDLERKIHTLSENLGKLISEKSKGTKTLADGHELRYVLLAKMMQMQADLAQIVRDIVPGTEISSKLFLDFISKWEAFCSHTHILFNFFRQQGESKMFINKLESLNYMEDEQKLKRAPQIINDQLSEFKKLFNLQDIKEESCERKVYTFRGVVAKKKRASQSGSVEFNSDFFRDNHVDQYLKDAMPLPFDYQCLVLSDFKSSSNELNKANIFFKQLKQHESDKSKPGSLLSGIFSSAEEIQKTQAMRNFFMATCDVLLSLIEEAKQMIVENSKIAKPEELDELLKEICLLLTVLKNIKTLEVKITTGTGSSVTKVGKLKDKDSGKNLERGELESGPFKGYGFNKLLKSLPDSQPHVEATFKEKCSISCDAKGNLLHEDKVIFSTEAKGFVTAKDRSPGPSGSKIFKEFLLSQAAASCLQTIYSSEKTSSTAVAPVTAMASGPGN